MDRQVPNLFRKYFELPCDAYVVSFSTKRVMNAKMIS